MSNTTSLQQIQHFTRIDKLIGEYYFQLGIDNYFDNSTGYGKFLQFIIQEEYNDSSCSLEDELGDHCSAIACGYLSFDDNFPVPKRVGILMNLNTEKDNIIFYILQYCFKYNKLPTNTDMQNKLISSDFPDSKQSSADPKQFQEEKIVIEEKSHSDTMGIIIEKFRIKLLCHIPQNLFGDSFLATNVINAFMKVIQHEQYTSIMELRDDLETDADSYIMDEIMSNNHDDLAIASFKSKIFDVLQSIVYNYHLVTPFDITQFNYDINASSYCNEIIKLWFEQYKDDINAQRCMFYSNGETLKAVDFANKFPLFISIIDAFSRYHVDQIKEFLLKRHDEEKQQYYNDEIISHSEWFNLKNNIISKYSKTYVKNMIFEMDVLFKHSVAGYRCNSMEFQIFDSYDIFTRYQIAINRFVHSISHKTAEPNHNYFPLQIDFWIIPRILMKRDAMSLDDSDSEADNDNENDVWTPQYVGKWDQSVWDIEDNLNDAGYIEGNDYWMLGDDDEKYGDYNIETLLKKFNGLWKQNEGWKQKQCQRYIMIIDRRNPEHICNEQIIDDSNTAQSWNDRIYLICPKRYNTVAKACECEYKMNEIFLQNTFYYMLPMLGKGDNSKWHEDLSAHLTNKLFILSYHIQLRNKVSTYWYSQHGILRFFVNDVQELWPGYFKKKNNGRYQKLTYHAKSKFKENLAKYRLRDEQFDEFMKQIYGNV